METENGGRRRRTDRPLFTFDGDRLYERVWRSCNYGREPGIHQDMSFFLATPRDSRHHRKGGLPFYAPSHRHLHDRWREILGECLNNRRTVNRNAQRLLLSFVCGKVFRLCGLVLCVLYCIGVGSASAFRVVLDQQLILRNTVVLVLEGSLGVFYRMLFFVHLAYFYACGNTQSRNQFFPFDALNSCSLMSSVLFLNWLVDSDVISQRLSWDDRNIVVSLCKA